jgi:hypothetical protein
VFSLKNQQRFIYKIIVSLITCLAFVSQVQGKSLVASTDRNVVGIADTFILQIEAKDIASLTSPDFSALDTGFEVLSKNVNHSMHNINGVSSQSIIWQLRLRAKQLGPINIPAFTLDGEQSNEIHLSVEKNEITAADDKNFRLQLTANKTEVVVGEQIIITEMFLFAKNVNNLRISEFKVENAEVIRLDDKSYESELNAKRYGVYEISYAVFPSAAGILNIKEQQLSVNLGRLNNQASNTITLQTEPISIKVSKHPASKTIKGQALLVADQVILSQMWSADSERIRLGESITREIDLQVKGARAHTLAPLAMPEIDGIKIYPEAGVKSEQKNDAGFSVQRSRKFAIVPTKVGRYVVPAMQIHWYNSKEKKVQLAELEEKIIEVIAAENSSAINPIINKADSQLLSKDQQNKTQSTNDIRKGDVQKIEVEKVVVEKVFVEKPLNYLLLASFVLASIIAIILVILLIKARNRLQQLTEKKDTTYTVLDFKVQEARLFSGLMTAIDNASQVKVQIALQHWMRFSNISDWQNTKLSESVLLLERSLYANDAVNEQWDKVAFKSLIKERRKVLLLNAKADNSDQALTDLYPVTLQKVS